MTVEESDRLLAKNLREVLISLVEMGMGRKKPLLFTTSIVDLKTGKTTAITARMDDVIYDCFKACRKGERELIAHEQKTAPSVCTQKGTT